MAKELQIFGLYLSVGVDQVLLKVARTLWQIVAVSDHHVKVVVLLLSDIASVSRLHVYMISISAIWE